MKRINIKLGLLCATLAFGSSVGLAQTTVPLVNADFEATGGWNAAGANNGGSGLTTGIGWCEGGNSGFYQIANYPMQTGDSYTLTWIAQNNWNGGQQIVTLLSGSATNTSFASTATLAAVTNTSLPYQTYAPYTVSYTAQAGDAGKFIGVHFRNPAAAGSWTFWDNFVLTVQPAGNPPVINTPPASQSVLAGATATFTVSATAAQSYQWQAGAVGSGVYTNITGATTASLVISNVSAGNQLDYIVVAINSSGSVTSAPPATLTVDTATLPSISTQPVSQTVVAGKTVTFTVTANSALTYQWKAGAVGSGIYTNLVNGGGISGVNSATLTIANSTLANTADYVVVVSNGNGSATSDPATLTVLPVIYREDFVTGITGNTPISVVGWRNDVEAGDARVFYYTQYGYYSVFSYANANKTEAFYVTTATETGAISNQMPFVAIDIATATNLALSVDLAPGAYRPFYCLTHFAVQVDGNWYVSTASQSADGTFLLPFDPAAGNWNQLTVSGSNSFNNVVIGGGAPADLTGHITGAGFVVEHFTADASHNLANFRIGGFIPQSTLPQINLQPVSQTVNSGSTVTFSTAATTNGSVAGLTYQWRAGTVGSGIYSPLVGAQFSGVNSNILTITGVTSANAKDYVVVVTDGAGSVTSAPATLTVVGSAPVLTTDTTISPNTVYASNHNTITISAAFSGSQPMSLQWRRSANADGSGAVNVAGATNSTLVLTNPVVSDAGYYSLHAANAFNPAADSSWVQLQVLPASGAFYHWSAPVPFNGLTAAQILGAPAGAFFEAAVAGPTSQTVQVGNTTYFFSNDGSVAQPAGGTTGAYPGTTSHTTGDTNFDAVLNQFSPDGGPKTITIHNLTAGLQYSVQLFALDDRGGDWNGSLTGVRIGNFQDPNDPVDVSDTFAMAANVYVIGTFTATGPDAVIQENLPLSGNGNFNAVVVRLLTPVPAPTLTRSGSNLQISWSMGTLLQSTNVTGPWTVVTDPSPITVSPTDPQMFYRTKLP